MRQALLQVNSYSNRGKPLRFNMTKGVPCGTRNTPLVLTNRFFNEEGL